MGFEVAPDTKVSRFSLGHLICNAQAFAEAGMSGEWQVMLDLDSPRWSELHHAYGTASDIPALLRQLEGLPPSEGGNEPWFSLWSALAHQGDVYPATFAAVPHVVHFLSQSPVDADAAYYQFPAWVEICRQKNAVPIPADLEAAYHDALAKLPHLVASAADRMWDADFLASALAAIAAAKGSGAVAEVVLELNTEIAEEFREWFYSR